MASPQLNIKWLNALNSKKVVLASSSPRRKDILNHLKIQYTVVPSTFPETLDKSLFSHPSEYVKENALQKALEVYERLKVCHRGSILPTMQANVSPELNTVDCVILCDQYVFFVDC